ncbi:cytochrome c [Pseudoruegeria sp. HB172150]|uniref:c-type cytochrome n=1 Tax=Pseudoruegeria sp. HB172150 TaxID=2721164 RepID=UPI001553FA42|nr:cytochrome c [Pseudoruegeria sp. HB172150]
MPPRNNVRTGTLLMLSVVLVACAPKPEPEPMPETTGAASFRTYCAVCHGSGADGAGQLSVFVPTGVPDLRGLSSGNGGTFPDTYVVEVVTRISDFHAGVVAMPDFGPLLDGEPVVYTASDGTRIETNGAVLEIVDYLRLIQN